jgi:hypothetical protein
MSDHRKGFEIDPQERVDSGTVEWSSSGTGFVGAGTGGAGATSGSANRSRRLIAAVTDEIFGHVRRNGRATYRFR